MRKATIIISIILFFMLSFLMLSSPSLAIPICGADNCVVSSDNCDPGFYCKSLACSCPVDEFCDNSFFTCVPCSDDTCSGGGTTTSYDYASDSVTVTVGEDPELSCTSSGGTWFNDDTRFEDTNTQSPTCCGETGTTNEKLIHYKNYDWDWGSLTYNDPTDIACCLSSTSCSYNGGCYDGSGTASQYIGNPSPSGYKHQTCYNSTFYWCSENAANIAGQLCGPSGSYYKCVTDGTNFYFSNTFPSEVCDDGYDNDCDSKIDCDDTDCSGDSSCGCTNGDTQTVSCGVGACLTTVTQTCSSGSWSPDCTPGTPSDETCNGIDDDCDNIVDEGVTTKYYYDYDNDGYGTNSFKDLCSSNGYYRASQNGDCNDNRSNIHPGATDITCNTVDEDCSGTAKEPTVCTTTLSIDVEGTSVPPASSVTPNDCDAQVTAYCTDQSTEPSVTINGVACTKSGSWNASSPLEFDCGLKGKGSYTVLCSGTGSDSYTFSITLEPDNCETECKAVGVYMNPWPLGSEGTSLCCGDDSGESETTKMVASDNTWNLVSYSTKKCCIPSNDCAYDDGCYVQGAVKDSNLLCSEDGIYSGFYECGPVHECLTRDSALCHYDGGYEWVAASLSGESSCSDSHDNDCDSKIDEYDNSCGITLSFNSTHFEAGDSVLASFGADDGSLPSGNRVLCDYQGCAADGSCIGSQIASTSEDTVVFSAPTADGVYGYYFCFGSNNAYQELAVGMSCIDDTICDSSDWSHAWCSIINPHLTRTYEDWSCNSNLCSPNNVTVLNVVCDSVKAKSGLDGSCGSQYCEEIPGSNDQYLCVKTDSGIYEWHLASDYSSWSESACDDGYDNDCDSKIDCDDTDCLGHACIDYSGVGGVPGFCQPDPETPSSGYCCVPLSNNDLTCDGVDDDCNGIIDDACTGDLIVTVKSGVTNKDYSYGDPIAGVSADLIREGSDFQEVSDNEGVLRFEKVPSETYSLVVKADGFDAYVDPVNIEQGKTVYKTVFMNVLNCHSDCTDGSGVCNPDCIGVNGCRLSQEIIDEGLSDLVLARCDGVPAGETRSLPGHSESVLCCGDLTAEGSSAGALFNETKTPVTINGCSKDLIKFTRVVNYEGRPVKLTVVTWDDCKE